MLSSSTATQFFLVLGVEKLEIEMPENGYTAKLLASLCQQLK